MASSNANNNNATSVENSAELKKKKITALSFEILLFTNSLEYFFKKFAAILTNMAYFCGYI